ncbi:MAG: NAD-dependent deacylase [Acidobacteriia bacterium]|nr:NAD-dependent deacylase [Terriglobia bacterium]
MASGDSIAEVAGRIRSALRITVLTGAGVSAASGVPTFRGPQGLWRNHAPEKLATPEAFESDPKLVWEWYNWRRELIAKCRPNAAHTVLAAWSRRYPRFTLITQNVDGLHEKAGAVNVVRFHGSIWEVLCRQRCPSAPARWWDDSVPLPKIPPQCPYCNGLLRPGVVWFGESIDPEVLERSLQATVCEVFMTVGTSAVVYPAAGLAREARSQGAFTVEINPESTPSSGAVDLAIQEPAEEVLPVLESLLLGSHESHGTA